MNALNRDIYCRPARRADGSLEPLILIDDLSAEVVARMHDDGLPLAICIESSPRKFHGWVRVSDQPISRDQAQALACELALRYGGDPAAASWNQYGRLAGFTNRKKERKTSRGAPFAKLHMATADVAPGGAALLAYMDRKLDQEQHQTQHIPASRFALKPASQPSLSAAAAFNEARKQVNVRRSDNTLDESSADFGATCVLLENGFDLAQIVAALLHVSPNVFERHSDAAAYALRTLEAAQRRVAGSRPASGLNPYTPRPR